MKYKALDISSFFISKGVSPLKLQKLLYYSQVWFFVKNDKKLFEDKIQAWIYGPVVYDVWYNFRFMKRGATIPRNRATKLDLDDVTLNHLNDIWKSYGHLSGAHLVDLTHDELPWKNSRKGILNDIPSNNEVMINKNTTSDFVLNFDDSIPVLDSVFSLGRFSNT